ncbi:MAG: hypothetical protein JST80_08140 [Bdellovibrionales bacterium]|nr:hypothetical protein [Bdellovibrionales bacterium]
MEKDKISFKPLHEGMGFHPFSDGLPYAPESKASTTTSKQAPKTAVPKTSSMGAGAMAAGRPQFATARQLKQIQEQHSITPVITRAPNPNAPKIISTKISGTEPAVKPVKVPAAPINPAEEKSLLRRRAFAYLMDTVIHAGFWLATNLTALFFFKFQVDAEIVQEHLSQFLLFFIVSQWLFIALQEMLFETTIGKAFFNLEFKRNHKSLFLRSIVFMIGLLAFGLGLYYRPHDKLGQLQLKSKLYSE